MKVSMIVAVDESNGIGMNDGKIPWKLLDDMKHFREVTIGKPIIMGRKTYESLPCTLPHRKNIVMTRDTDPDNPLYKTEGIEVVNDVESALAAAKRSLEVSGGNEVVIIGGAEIYNLFAPHASDLHLTRVHTNANCDVKLDIDTSVLSLKNVDSFERDENNEFDFTVEHYTA